MSEHGHDSKALLPVSHQAHSAAHAALGLGDILAHSAHAHPLAKALPIVSGGFTAATHDPATSGAAGVAERTGVGVAQGLWDVAGGPVAALDAMTGNNIGGLMQLGVSGTISTAQAIARGDTRALGKLTDQLEEGQYGTAAKVAAQVGGAAGGALYDAANTDHSLVAGARRSVRDGQRELVEQGDMSWDSYRRNWNAR